MGLFEPYRLQDDSVRKKDNSEPSLAELVSKAVVILGKNPKGFYLFVEGWWDGIRFGTVEFSLMLGEESIMYRIMGNTIRRGRGFNLN